MNEPTPEQIAKLPKWARDYIAALQRRDTYATKALTDHLDSQTKSAVWTQRWNDSAKQERYYIQDETVCFSVPGGYIEVRLHTTGIREGSIAIRGVPNMLCVMPEAGNSLTVKMDKI